ncbi:hypothetical protein N7510_004054 [Penicillium lagena]|uniref:uncharacterized protein n=1 Tax=Penicillium lagena TaxID=94218 RepID=UPI00253FF435|nr:uncharacterized protein N7510_004054 [Penicillium lagena]KAJ5620070.1 hypothetical protein N7510_004054 [Penicillium lagena]
MTIDLGLGLNVSRKEDAVLSILLSSNLANPHATARHGLEWYRHPPTEHDDDVPGPPPGWIFNPLVPWPAPGETCFAAILG